MNPQVIIIILNWNGWEDTLECLESIYQINYPNYDIIVVDNNSEDDSIERIEDYCEGKIKVSSPFFKYISDSKPIELIEYSEDALKSTHNMECKSSDKRLFLLKNDKNYGFAEGNNIGINYAIQSDPDYILLLNNDTVVEKDFLNKLVEVAEADEDVGILGPLIYYYDFDGKTNVPANLGGKVDLSKYPGYYDLVEVDNEDTLNDIIECDWISGAAMMMKSRDVPIKYLNNTLFFGNEDIDLCINLKERGYKIISVHNSIIWHKEGVSRKKRSSALIKKVLLEIEVNLKFLKLHKNHFYLYLPVYILQIAVLYFALMLKKKV
jgi:GT2 family glycosyltransferase